MNKRIISETKWFHIMIIFNSRARKLNFLNTWSKRYKLELHQTQFEKVSFSYKMLFENQFFRSKKEKHKRSVVKVSMGVKIAGKGAKLTSSTKAQRPGNLLEYFKHPQWNMWDQTHLDDFY